MRIPLESLDRSEQEKIKKIGGRYIVVIDEEPCLTCGHKTRLVHLERTDGKQEIVRECLYCLTNHCHTATNRSAP